MSYEQLMARLDAITPESLTEDQLWVAAEVAMTIEWGTAEEKAEIAWNRRTWASRIGILAENIRGENPNGVKGTTYGDICEIVMENHGW